jgi:hypothetical protein
LGVLFALQNFTRFGFDQTWPVLLIVFGLLSLMQRGAAPPSPPPPPRNYPPTTGFPQSSAGSSQNPRGYAQSPYAQPPASADPSAAPSKGGFGTSAPPRADSSGSTPSSSEGGPA